MTGLKLFAKLQRLWASWDVRCFVLLSLILQSFLLLIAPLRKRSISMKIYCMVWLTYLLADWTALFAVGLISNTQSARPIHGSGNKINDVMVFWSPFLLVHLGGPDTITAVALEDNELWARHLLKLLGQLVSTGLVFYRSFPNNELLLPTILMFLAGIIKYSERIRSLHRASFKKISNVLLKKPDPGPNYAKLMEEFTTRSESRKPIRTTSVREPYKAFEYQSPQRSDHKKERVPSMAMVRNAYCYYMTFRGLVADLIFSRHDSQESQLYLLQQDAERAFRVVEIELNFIYEVLFTKSVIIHDGAQLGFLLRFLYSTLVLLTFGLWHFKHKKSKNFSRNDVKITNILLFGAIALDVVSYCLFISSDWMTALVKMKEEKEDPTTRGRCMVRIGGAICRSKVAAHTYLTKRAPKIFSRRWSESIQQHNLIDSCLLKHQLWDKLCDIMGMQDIRDDFKEVTPPRKFYNELRDRIFKELQSKTRANPDDIHTKRGEWVLEHYFSGARTLLSDWVSKVEYDESLILWHIATDLCYFGERFDIPSGQHNDDHDNEGPAGDYKEKWAREMSKVLSDYMLHLLLREPKMMAEVSSIARIRFRDTVAEAEVFINNLLRPDNRKSPLQRLRGPDQEYEKQRLRLVINSLWEVKNSITPTEAKGDRSKSVLFDGCRLARTLKDEIPKEINKWELICSVWVEMLCYAAVHCRGNVHAASLGKGGHLVTLVWMLMMNLGLGKQFRIKEGNKRTKLVEADN